MDLSRTLRRRVAAALCATALPLVALVHSPAQAQETPAAVAATASRAKAMAASALEGAQSVANAALSLLGVGYKWGGSSPETGLDCSGLVQYVFQQTTGVVLPRTAKAMSRVGERVKVEDLRPGDLVFFNTRRFAFSHVGIYLGDNRFIHAPARGREVEIAALDAGYWKKRFSGARRLAAIVPELLAPLVSDAEAAPMPAPLAPDAPAFEP